LILLKCLNSLGSSSISILEFQIRTLPRNAVDYYKDGENSQGISHRADSCKCLHGDMASTLFLQKFLSDDSTHNNLPKFFHFAGSFVIASFTACLLLSEPVKSWSGNLRYFTISSKMLSL
jgi:hypothetical protein